MPADDPADWADAACRGKPSDWWFPMVSPGRLGLAGNWGRARRICDSCPRQAQCADWALRQVDLHGIWGGLTPSERDRERDTRRRAGIPVCPLCAARMPHHLALAAHLDAAHKTSHLRRKLTTTDKETA